MFFHITRTLLLATLVLKSAAKREFRGNVLSAAEATAASHRLEKDAFSIVALPDTQYYTGAADHAELFTEQIRWIVDEVSGKNQRNIVFVSHLGDMVDRGVQTVQWQRANASMSLLGPPGGPFVVPHSVLPGNHDFTVPMDVVDWSPRSVKSYGAEKYVSFFGPSRFRGASWYKGSDPSGLNSFQTFTAGGMEMLHLALEWQPTLNLPERALSPIAWATQVLADHPGLPTILSTHEYMKDAPSWRTLGAGGRSEAGDELFDALVRSNNQIFLVLCGHFHMTGRFGGEWQQVSTNDFGNPVIEILSDYQDYSNGGDGWLRIMTFVPSEGLLRVQTYSPVLQQYKKQTGKMVDNTLSNFRHKLNFKDRFAEKPSRSGFGHLWLSLCPAIVVTAHLLGAVVAQTA